MDSMFIILFIYSCIYIYHIFFHQIWELRFQIKQGWNNIRYKMILLTIYLFLSSFIGISIFDDHGED